MCHTKGVLRVNLLNRLKYFIILKGFELYWLENLGEIVLQHAPYDAMVLVSMCWYIDQQLKATDGKWKVSGLFFIL